MSSTRSLLTKAQRLRSPADFKRVYDNKQWGNTRLFSFNVLHTGAQSQLGVTVSKKVSKSAVRRNRIKRVIKEFYRCHQFDIKNASIVITAKPAADLAGNQELWVDLDELWQKLLKWQRWQQCQLRKQSHGCSD